MSATKEQVRLDNFNSWLNQFAQYFQDSQNQVVQYIDDAPSLLNTWYWMHRELDLIPFMKTENNLKINRYKVISGIELTIVGVQPIIHDNISERSRLNAELAWFVGLTVLLDWDDKNIDEESLTIFFKQGRVKKFIQEHIDWLTKLDPESSYPIFSNSHTWWNFDLSLDLFLGIDKTYEKLNPLS